MHLATLRLAILIIFLSLAYAAIAQAPCETSSELWKDYQRFMPQEGTPLFTIKVNYVVPQKDDGSANFQKDNPEHIELLEKSFKKINKLWGQLKRPKDEDCYPHDDFLEDTYIRFVLNEIIFVQNDYYWNADNGSGCPSNSDNWFLNSLEKEIRSNKDYDGSINVYLTNLPGPYEEIVVDQTSKDPPKAKPPCSELPTAKDLNRSLRINMAGSYNKYWWMKNVVPGNPDHNAEGKSWEEAIKYWMSGTFEHTMTHELGHSVGLNHANEYHGRNKCDESIMNQLHGKEHNYLQPTEIAKIHRNLRMTNLRNFLAEDVYSPIPFIIAENTEFSMDYKAYEDIIVKSGSTLKVTCALDLPAQARIIIEPDAQVVVKDAMIHHRNAANRIGGIVLQKEKRCFLRKRSAREKGKLVLEGNAQYIGTTIQEKIKLDKQ